MNTKSICHANNEDLRGSWHALPAHEVAAQTGTELIVSRNGVIERIRPQIESKIL